MADQTMSVSDANKLLNRLYRDIADNKQNVSSDNGKRLLSSFDRLRNIIIKKMKPDPNGEESIEPSAETKKKKRKLTDRMIHSCYICKVRASDDEMHKIYQSMCEPCGDLNLSRRDFKKNMSGKVAIVTGGRIKIGFETALRLLRNGSTVVVTTRFVDDSIQRYMKEPDYNEFKHLLTIYQLDMMGFSNIMNFVKYIYTKFDHIDILINNAAQTIQRPYEFYKPLLLAKRICSSEGNAAIPLVAGCDNKLYIQQPNDILKITDLSTNNSHPETSLLAMDPSAMDPSAMNPLGSDLSEIDQKEQSFNKTLIPTQNQDYFPEGQIDQFGQQLDLRPVNSWILEMDQVNPLELSQVMVTNSVAPYILCSNLKQLLTKTSGYSYIINVSSMEGCFNWSNKSSAHPHNNMSKAALNMMTRTCGKYFFKSNIIMVSVDTGWNNSQSPLPVIRSRASSYEERTPLDCADGAARILWPIYSESNQYGVLYKDFEIRNW